VVAFHCLKQRRKKRGKKGESNQTNKKEKNTIVELWENLFQIIERLHFWIQNQTCWLQFVQDLSAQKEKRVSDFLF
jgi:hypothetical protein